MVQNKIIIKAVRLWVETIVVGLNLCPFAGRELVNDRIRFSVSEAATEEQLLMDLRAELDLLQRDETSDTSLLIHPYVLMEFDVYNQFLNYADSLLVHMDLEGIYQIASFHPDYQFANTEPDDVENFTNRSPYPMLHLIREKSLQQAIENYPDTDKIPERNIDLLKSMGRDKMQALWLACFKPSGK